MRNRIRNILILMSACILGIFAFQGYWLYNAYDLKMQEFNKNINEALGKAIFNKQFFDASKMIAYRMKDDTVFNLKFKTTTPQVFIDSFSSTLPHSSGNKAAFIVRSTARWADSLPAATGATVGVQGARVYADTLARKISDILIMNKIYDTRFSIKKMDALYAAELHSLGIYTPYKLDTLRIPTSTFRETKQLVVNYHPNHPNRLVTSTIPFNPLSNIAVRATFSSPFRHILGKMTWTLLSSAVLLLFTVLCFLYMLRTILKQKKLSEVRNDFINNMTHELKTPIATVSAAVEAMQNFNALNDTRKTENYLRISRQELQRLSDLVEKVLHIAAEEKEELELFREETDINELVGSIIANHRLKANKKVDFTYTILANPVVNVDKTHLSNAINNLVDNAIKYSGEPVEITIQVARQQDRLKIMVKDNGIGIPGNYQESIFEKFFRVPTGNIHNVKGFGLGLSYVKKIVEKHGGTIRVKSEPEKGSEFHLEIPEI